ncbi:MBL fold metallo-hydrolase [Galactobacter caseinivorans]|uniref:MBL fold metallo-hydrolase n=1 Tax=Galactobacter caseinivorans TaxID=2676123 RepID=A0A496PH43_9MICC|nr:MBL fold metallo-hydrolase [Galactobacter caseinivorans]RKW69789.1 MBL fold metallo-hydrolase [Galactobacter caseinivorans]
MSGTIERVVTSGTFSLDGGTWEVENNVWIVGDDAEVLVIDPAHDVVAVSAAVGSRRVVAVLLTHGHDDHVRAAVEAGSALAAPVFLPAADRMLWDMVHSTAPDGDVEPGQEFTAGPITLRAVATPGHTPGSTCYVSEAAGVVFSGDTLFAGGPGATGRSYSDFATIVDSITTELLTLPGSTRVLTGHGDETTIGAEAPHRQEWIDRGH